MLNRSALVLRPAKPFNDWLASVFPDDDAWKDAGEPTVYLVPPYEDEAGRRAILEVVYPGLFAAELEAWCTHEARWPENRTLAMFERWFHVETHAIVEDTWSEDGPIEEEAAGE